MGTWEDKMKVLFAVTLCSLVIVSLAMPVEYLQQVPVEPAPGTPSVTTEQTPDMGKPDGQVLDDDDRAGAWKADADSWGSKDDSGCAESDKGDTKVESKADDMVDQNQANAEAIGEASVPPTESVEDVSTPARALLCHCARSRGPHR